MSKSRKLAIILMSISAVFTVIYEVIYVTKYFVTMPSWMSGLSDAFAGYIEIVGSLFITLALFMDIQMLFIVFTALFHKPRLRKGFGIAMMSTSLVYYGYLIISSVNSMRQIAGQQTYMQSDYYMRLGLRLGLEVFLYAILFVLSVIGIVLIAKKKKVTILFAIFAGAGVLLSTVLFFVRTALTVSLVLGTLFDIIMQLAQIISDLTFFCAFAAIAIEAADAHGQQPVPAVK